MEEPRDVLAAPSHPDPYDWYARLRVHSPLAYDARLQLWVVAGPYLVEQALRHPQLRVRPPAEPVPPALLGGAAGEVFALLVRMNDGAFHARHRPLVERAFDSARVAQAAEAATRDLQGRLDANALLTAIPVQAMARLLGVRREALDATVEAVHAFVRGIAPGADAGAIARAHEAAAALMAPDDAVADADADAGAGAGVGADGECGGARGDGGDRNNGSRHEGSDACDHGLLWRVAAANRIALMQQALDATAGLIGNALLAARAPGGIDAGELVAQVARRDPAVHNTRRWAAADLELGGQRIRAGDALLLLLVNGCPFGGGVHGCPGERVALQMAAAAVRALQPWKGGALTGYRPLSNARVPVFA